MRDFFGIRAAVLGAANVYFRTARGSGRTLALVESLRDGDRVVFTNAVEAKRVQRMCMERGVAIKILVMEPKDPHGIFDRGGPSKGRTMFDHTWVEQYYLAALERAGDVLDHCERESSGHGTPHIETRLRAREISKWQL